MHHLIYNFNFHLMYDIFFWGKIPWHPLNFRVCLFVGEIGWMENFEMKMGKKTFLKCV